MELRQNKENNIHNRKNLRYLSEAYRRGRLSHAYIIEGDPSSGKEEFVRSFAAALLCDRNVKAGKMAGESSGPELQPCGICPSCIKASTFNHPDIIQVTHEKPTVLSVNEIREQLVGDIIVKPYYGPYKIYIVPDAQLMNESAQNALLKTIEEPEEYGLIFLLTDNADGLLQTILSRCIVIKMPPAGRDEIAHSLLDEDGQRVLEILSELSGMDAVEIDKAAKEMEGFDKQQILEIMRLWSRDLLVYKCTGESGRLFLPDEKGTAAKAAGSIPYEAADEILRAVKDADGQIVASVKAEAVYENMLIRIRRALRRK